MISPSVASRSRRTSNWVWFSAYLVTIGVVVLTVFESRRVTLREMDTPEAISQWQAWREAKPNRADSGPVQRRPPSSTEPPALVLLRDHFVVMMAAAVLFSSLVFAAIMVAARGAFSSSDHPADSRESKTIEGGG